MESENHSYPVRRPRYFSGRMLSAADLETEQQYFREKLKRHNRYLHGSGLVDGLEVTVENNHIVVARGLALDCTGEEIYVPETVRILPPDVNHVAFLMIRFTEQPLGFAPGGQGDEAQPLYIAETFDLSYEFDDPYLGHGEDPLVWVPCGKSHALPLAKLFQRRDTWEVDPWFQAPGIG